MSNITNLSRVVHALRVRRLTNVFCLKTPAFACNLARFLHSNYSSSRTFPKHRIECATHYTSSAKKDTVRIGCASGFWGDTAASVPQLIYSGQIDYLVFDYLSEITMSLLTVAKTKMPNMGYAPDFVQIAIAPFIHDIHKKGIRVVSNAGGVNPLACAAAIQEVVKKAGLDLKVAVVTGDDLMAQKDSLSEVRMADGVSRSKLPTTVHSMNAYLGAVPIQRCLDLGADIVVTGRCVDSAVALGPLMHSFGWKQNNYDLLAAGSLAGHLIECGAQATGGIFTDWHTVPDWDNMGFPVVECSADGSFILSKPPKTGGLVSFGTVAEQLVYEIGDPQKYLLPDVTCDFSNVNITEVAGVEGGAVKVTGARGFSPSNDYKVCATYMDGYRATAVCPVGGPRATEKARRTAESIIKRTRRMFKQLGLEDFTAVNIQVLGAEDTYGPHSNNTTPREVVVWMAVRHKQKKALEFFAREIAPAGTGMGRSVNTHASWFIMKNQSHQNQNAGLTLLPFLLIFPSLTVLSLSPDLPSGPHSYRLEELAYTRSGDKGDSSNIGVISRHPLYFPYLKKHLTETVVGEYFHHLIQPDTHDAVTRYELPGIHALNFILQSSLGGGGVASIRCDPQGKAYGQMLLDLKLTGLPDLKSLVD
uniref:Si:ch73-132f6.5 n=1 Tax=Oncorhynchus mykiss TaxID=8022 RepID=A0A8K9XX17_ONCMY